MGPIFLKDGTFESQPAGDKSRPMFIDDTGAATGKQSLCLHNPVGGHLADAAFLDVKPSTRYRISMKIKRTATHSIYAMLWMARADARQRAMKPLGGYAGKLNEWQEFSQEFETPEDLYALRLYCYNRLKDVKAWYDDILVEELGPVTESTD